MVTFYLLDVIVPGYIKIFAWVHFGEITVYIWAHMLVAAVHIITYITKGTTATPLNHGHKTLT